MKALVVVSHPDPGSLNHALADAVRQAWARARCEVVVHDLHSEGFDPVLTATEARGAASDDPVVQRHIAELRAADLLGIIHPNQWGAPPAMMKGWIDRVFAPEAAYGFAKGADGGDAPVGLLRTRAAVVLNTGNTPLDREAGHFGDPLDAIWRRCVLGYCGVGQVSRRLFGVVATSSAAERQAWLREAAAMAEEAHQLARP